MFILLNIACRKLEILEVLKKEDVKTLLEAHKSVNRETLYEKEINTLKPCEAIRLTTED